MTNALTSPLLLSDAYRMVELAVNKIIEQQETHEHALKVYQEELQPVFGTPYVGQYFSGYVYGVFDAKMQDIRTKNCEFCWVVNGVAYALNGPSNRPLTSELDPHLLTEAPNGFFWKKEKSSDPDKPWFMGRGHA